MLTVLTLFAGLAIAAPPPSPPITIEIAQRSKNCTWKQVRGRWQRKCK